jgi:carbon storage regulator
MLLLSRKPGQQIIVNGNVVITVVEIKRDGGVRIGIEAPRYVAVHRAEVWEEIQRDKQGK